MGVAGVAWCLVGCAILFGWWGSDLTVAWLAPLVVVWLCIFRHTQLEDLEHSHKQHFKNWREITTTDDINPILLESATQQAKRIKEGSITSLELVQMHINQIKRVNPLLVLTSSLHLDLISLIQNAMVQDRFEEALKEAQRADELLRGFSSSQLSLTCAAERGPSGVPPFHGVPCSIKEAFAVRGQVNCSGLKSRKHLRAEQGEHAGAVADNHHRCNSRCQIEVDDGCPLLMVL